MISAPVFWGVVCGAIYFLVMWWIRARRLEEQRESTRLLYALSEEIVAAHTPSGIAERLEETLPLLLKASRVEIDLGAEGQTRAQEPGHALSLPLTSYEQTLGEIRIYRPEPSGEFADEEQAVAQHVANIVSAALQLQKKHRGLREKLFEEEAAEEPPASSEATAQRVLTLLLVDPHLESRRTLLKALSSRGHRVVPCAAAESADLARRFSFDAILHIADHARNGSGAPNEFWLARPVDEEALDRILTTASSRNGS